MYRPSSGCARPRRGFARLPARGSPRGGGSGPWLVALALVSYLGSYGGEAAHEIGRGVGVLVIAAISIAVYVAAYRLRLPGRRVKELIEEAANRG